MKTETIRITPRQAKAMLASNTSNRKPNPNRIKYYANLMKNGKWHLTHQGIAIAADGTIVDGQHRLMAVLDSGKSVMFNVSWGVEKEAQKYIDVGYRRTTSNVFQMHGVADASAHAAGIGKYFKMSLSKTGADSFSANSRNVENALTHDDYLQFYSKNENVLIEANRLSQRAYATYKFYSKSALYGFILFCANDKKHPLWMIESFFDELYMRKPYSERATGLLKLLFKTLVNDATGNKSLKNEVKGALLIKTYNAYLMNKGGKMLRYSPGANEEFPKIIDVSQIEI